MGFSLPRLGALAALLLGLGVCGAQAQGAPALAPAGPAPGGVDPFVQVREMGRGLNILGYDPIWTDPAKARFRLHHFEAIRNAGFSTVRINLQAFAHMDAQNRLDPLWATRLDRVVKAATARGLKVILDEHDFNICGENVSACAPRLTAFWRQIGYLYASAPDSLLFEILNEPNGQLNDETWNRLLAVELAEIRSTNPTRNVIIGPAFWNSPDHLNALKLPLGDRHIIVTVHYYTPMEFTHQGASWVAQYARLSGVHWGTDAEKARVDADFDAVQAWSRSHNRPILLGEFGAYDKAPMADRVVWTSTVARAAEKRGWAWAYWQFDSDFIVWDMAKDAWVLPIKEALLPPS